MSQAEIEITKNGDEPGATEDGPGIISFPPEVNEALRVLWRFSDDAHMTLVGQKELDLHGYECSTPIGWELTMVFPMAASKGDMRLPATKEK